MQVHAFYATSVHFATQVPSAARLTLRFLPALSPRDHGLADARGHLEQLLQVCASGSGLRAKLPRRLEPRRTGTLVTLHVSAAVVRIFPKTPEHLDSGPPLEARCTSVSTSSLRCKWAQISQERRDRARRNNTRHEKHAAPPK